MAGMDVESREAVKALNADERRLHELGYKQELKRGLGTINNGLISFSIISVNTGVSGLYGASLYQGGPASTTYGWPFVVAFVLCVGGSLAEICSAFPTSGGELHTDLSQRQHFDANRSDGHCFQFQCCDADLPVLRCHVESGMTLKLCSLCIPVYISGPPDWCLNVLRHSHRT